MTYYESIALLVVILGWPISAYFAYRCGLRSQERGNISRERADLIPVIKDAIFECGRVDQPQYAWRIVHCQKIGALAPRFSTFLKGKRQAAFDAAWYKCCQTQDAELLDPDVKASQKLITSRLQAVLDCVEQA